MAMPWNRAFPVRKGTYGKIWNVGPHPPRPQRRAPDPEPLSLAGPRQAQAQLAVAEAGPMVAVHTATSLQQALNTAEAIFQSLQWEFELAGYEEHAITFDISAIEGLLGQTTTVLWDIQALNNTISRLFALEAAPASSTGSKSGSGKSGAISLRSRRRPGRSRRSAPNSKKRCTIWPSCGTAFSHSRGQTGAPASPGTADPDPPNRRAVGSGASRLSASHAEPDG